ncbi:MAG: polysaccharide deacetylase family protein [archaeon]
MNISLSFDVEEDLHSPTYKSLEEGLPRLLNILDRHGIKVTFFVPAKLIEKFPNYFKDLSFRGHEIALHGYEHERFDDLTLFEKERRIKEAIRIYKKVFKEIPKGFRAPQHSIDEQTLHILEKNKFVYDSSYTPVNILQIFFFPKRLGHGLKGFFTPRSRYFLSKKFQEIPVSSSGIPGISLFLRVFSGIFLKLYLSFLRATHKNLVFYTHSWDFIELPKSKIDKKFPYKNLLKNLDCLIRLSKKDKFVTLEKLASN